MIGQTISHYKTLGKIGEEGIYSEHHHCYNELLWR
jgi:hypothetical protein